MELELLGCRIRGSVASVGCDAFDIMIAPSYANQSSKLSRRKGRSLAI